MFNTDTLIGLTMRAMLLCLYVTLPVTAVAAGAGLLVSFVQAITSLQDQSIAHGVKQVAVIATLALTGAWAASQILRFATQIFTLAVPS
jgi:type III secretion protein S